MLSRANNGEDVFQDHYIKEHVEVVGDLRTVFQRSQSKAYGTVNRSHALIHQRFEKIVDGRIGI